MNKKCLLCESINWNKYCEIENGKYKVLICKECSFTTLSPIPTDNELNEFYSKQYRDQYSNQDEVSDEVVAYEQLRADRVVEVVNDYYDSNYKNILDIGCSRGTLLKNISKLSKQSIPHGIEMNDKYRNFIIENNIANKKNISNDDINSYYKEREEKFDFISIVHVLEHLRNPKETLESIHKLLSTKGKLFIEVPNLKTPYNNLRTRYFAMYHLYNFTEYTLRKLLIDSGFKILKEKQIAGTSICFICEKETIFHNKKEYDKNEYLKVIRILNRYELLYPLQKLRLILIGILDFLGIKNFIKSILR